MASQLEEINDKEKNKHKNTRNVVHVAAVDQ